MQMGRKLRFETDTGAVQHHFIIGRFRPDGQQIARHCHVKAHGFPIAWTRENFKPALRFLHVAPHKQCYLLDVTHGLAGAIAKQSRWNDTHNAR
jgi:hypothetical protein